MVVCAMGSLQHSCRGLGWTHAKSTGDVLAENTVMLAMWPHLGFEVNSDQYGICNVRLAL